MSVEAMEQEVSQKLESTPLKFKDWYPANYREVIPAATLYMSALKHAYECGVAVEREACCRELQRHAAYIIHNTNPDVQWNAIPVLENMAHIIKARGEL